jgi:hypothetical protein
MSITDRMRARLTKPTAAPPAPEATSLSAILARAKANKAKANEWMPIGEVHTIRLVPRNGEPSRLLAKARLQLPRLMARLHPSKPLQLQVCGKAEAEWIRTTFLQ